MCAIIASREALKNVPQARRPIMTGQAAKNRTLPIVHLSQAIRLASELLQLMCGELDRREVGIR